MIDERTLSTGVRVVLGRDNQIVWSSDWAALVRLELTGTGEVTHKMYGPGTYCHTEYFLRDDDVTTTATLANEGATRPERG